MFRILFPRDLWWLNTISKLAEKFRLSATGPYVLHFNQRCYERKLAFYTNTLKLFSDPTSSASKSSTINGYLLQGRSTVPQHHCFFRSSYLLIRSKKHLIFLLNRLLSYVCIIHYVIIPESDIMRDRLNYMKKCWKFFPEMNFWESSRQKISHLRQACPSPISDWYQFLILSFLRTL